jgi:hypothetical protein
MRWKPETETAALFIPLTGENVSSLSVEEM